MALTGRAGDAGAFDGAGAVAEAIASAGGRAVVCAGAVVICGAFGADMAGACAVADPATRIAVAGAGEAAVGV